MILPPRAEALAMVCAEHFPKVDRARIEEEAFGADVRIRRELRGRMTRKLRRGRPPETACVGTRSPADVLRRARDAIERQDAWAWRKAFEEFDERVAEIYEDALAAFTGGDSWAHPFGEQVADVIGPTSAAVAADPEHWRVRHAAIEAALNDKRLKGRPEAGNLDESIRILVGLWECLSGRAATQPGRVAGSSERVGDLATFVAASAGVYKAEGLHRAVPRNSGSAWTRILGL
jgi:hypothetical protein